MIRPFKTNKFKQRASLKKKVKKDFNLEALTKVKKCNSCNQNIYWRMDKRFIKYMADYPSNRKHDCRPKVKLYSKEEIEKYIGELSLI